MVDVGARWTGRTACLLQAALRMSNVAFARHLGVALRTVAAWHETPARTPNSEMQQILATALEKAPDAARARFAAALHESSAPTDAEGAAYALTVAIAVVRDDARVLLVQRRGGADEGDSWQFPAGMVKPGLAAPTVAVRETLAETGVQCAPATTLGRRVHPITHVLCEYVLCDYLDGEPENRDIGENVSVAWATTSRLALFIPTNRIYPPVLTALGVHV